MSFFCRLQRILPSPEESEHIPATKPPSAIMIATISGRPSRQPLENGLPVQDRTASWLCPPWTIIPWPATGHGHVRPAPLAHFALRTLSAFVMPSQPSLEHTKLLPDFGSCMHCGSAWEISASSIARVALLPSISLAVDVPRRASVHASPSPARCALRRPLHPPARYSRGAGAPIVCTAITACRAL